MGPAAQAPASPVLFFAVDRGPRGLADWHRLRDQGTHPLWRIERRKSRRVQNVLPDGSYLARIEANRHSGRDGSAPPAPVRVIEYRIDGQPDIIRLITSLTDHETYPGAELAALHARRRETELVFNETKMEPLQPGADDARHRAGEIGQTQAMSA